MMNICFNCGLYRADKLIDAGGPHAICPECGHKHPFLHLPLLIISGASGVGKSTVCHDLLGTFHEVVLLDVDILWRPEFNRPESKYRDFFETWLRVAKNISQSRRPVVLFGAALGVPENMEPCLERRYFSDLHYLALVCSDDALVERLQNRPAWRQGENPKYIEEHIRFYQWFKKNGKDLKPPIELLDTTEVSARDTSKQVAAWVMAKIEKSNLPKTKHG